MRSLTSLLETHTLLVLTLAAILIVGLIAAGDALGVAVLDATGHPTDATELVEAGWRRP